MPVALEIPDQYSYVLAVATTTFFLNTVHMLRTSKFRKLARVPYPAPYASDEEVAKNPSASKFNCAQRAHANFTENLTPFLGSLLVAGVQHPVAAATLGGAWSFSRLIYLLGYTSDAGPKGRVVGFGLSALCDIILKGYAAYTCYQLIF
ncbi:Membrane associated eicosanoid/glutathione metabolism-like domain protein [Cordyceps fumosorosea ARSEF 2679]|uniref:Membrane associated eicosanoid/glutathione metabolism-like domain protein n=1 Tax=Cordyceps fumosorosea (strain ARSEF 2679) TaxID=1081104 RepID=A0A162MSE8_CORFA|nr:Membrane associated eicosanoid/glutathione metabolism-like domain protein [Cordyceps fumosorosea ARSEF 2679]OAA66200.1 Membrane associated eicosanoid/glutathione metabolism-like domain protein [Cordyceps fumosorosea ARSEF 2679]